MPPLKSPGTRLPVAICSVCEENIKCPGNCFEDVVFVTFSGNIFSSFCSQFIFKLLPAQTGRMNQVLYV